MTTEIIILVFIAVLLVVNTVIKIIICQDARIRRKEYIESITLLCNLLAEVLDSNKKGQL